MKRSPATTLPLAKKMGRRGLAFFSLLSAVAAHAADIDPGLPLFQPTAVATPKKAGYLTPDGAIAIVGYNDMRDMLEALVALYTKAHPGARFSLELKSTRSAPIALAAGTSLFAPMGARFTPPQLAGYRAATGADPLQIRVAHDSLDPRALSGPLAIFVNIDNPLPSLTVDQIRQTFTGQARRWGDLGLHGQWAERPIHLYGVEADRPLALELREAAFPGRAFSNAMAGFRSSAQVVEKVSADPAALGFAAAIRTQPSVRALAIATRAGETPVELSAASVSAGRYPLDRFLLIYVRPPMDPVAREFLRLVLSREGQQAIADGPLGYLPLTAAEAAVERAKLQ
jgi:phosphate transport system substrate-binding protein